MRGLGLLVLFAVACSAAGVDPGVQGLATGGSAGMADDSSGAPGEPAAGATVAAGGEQEPAGGSSSGGRGSAGQSGAQARAGASAGVGGGASGHGGNAGLAGVGGSSGSQSGSGGKAQGGSVGLAGSAGAAQAGSGTGGAGQCSGFTEYVVPVNTCLVISGDYQMQTDPVGCSVAGVVSRNQCFTCAMVTATNGDALVLLSPGTTTKSLPMSSGVCPSNCKYICS